MYRSFLKPLLDFAFAVLLLIITAPLMIFVAAFTRIIDGFNPIFVQKRIKRHGEIFDIYKFQTMNSAQDPSGKLLPDEKRITKLGHFLRNTSIDELPQLFNVAKGDMSIIGPRPLLPNYNALYNDFQRRRNEVKPGITGWAQVNGRNNVPWQKRFEMDVWYVDNLSFWLDLKIMLLTVKKVFSREDVSQDGHATSEEFKGNI